ncbi:hypothetical protein PV325_013861 [Microctonus aethiopoides]|nr:hypothetical protein PV325_013861 [Microctonus aethiopoides]KAK0098022.1 hypothetical protein PV326_011695 [Microctonus aethiopoides]
MDTRKYDTDEELQCRICAEYITDNNGRIHIFGEEARKNYLQTKIRKYLYVLVSSDDRLPKMVCFTCMKRLEGIHRFATMAHRAQERLKYQFYKSSDMDRKTKYPDDDDEDNDDDDDDDDEDDIGDDNEKSNHQGLLRSILIRKDGPDIQGNTKPSSPSDLSILPVHSIDNEVSLTTMEEMEVKVDPMIFLQCGLDRSPSPEASDINSDNDESRNYQSKDSPMQGDDARRKYQRNALSKSIDNRGSSEDLTNTESFDCDICSRSFESQINLQNHLWLHLPHAERCYNDHTDNSASFNNGENFVCPICNKKISTKGNLKVHLETHRPKGKYGCDICGRIFKTQSNLFRHKEYHGGIQFPCSVCGRVYPTNSTLRAHSITHSDLRPHACPLCDKTFKRNQDLKFHINQHTGARPYQCPYCPKAFASSGNCFSHRKRMHPKEVHRDRQRAADLMR